LNVSKKGAFREWEMAPKFFWEDSWVPSSHNLKIMTLKGANIVNRVSYIVDPIDGTWDEELIESIFWPVDVHRILHIP
jgi:hypothetical protein